MKTLSTSVAALVLLALTRPGLPQSPAATHPATAPSSSAPYSLTDYEKQIEERYHIPPQSPDRALDAKVPAENLLRMVLYSAQGGLPLDIIENAGDARGRFRAQYEEQRKKTVEADAAILGIIGPMKHDGTEILDQDINDGIAALRQELDRATLTMEVKQSKEQYLHEKIDEITDIIAQKTKTDEVMTALDALLQLKIADRQRIQTTINAHAAPATDLAAADAEVAQARIALARRREDIAANAYGGALAELGKSQIDISLEFDEQKATIQALEKRLGKLQDAKNAHAQQLKLDHLLTMMQDLETVERRAAAPAPK